MCGMKQMLTDESLVSPALETLYAGVCDGQPGILGINQTDAAPRIVSSH